MTCSMTCVLMFLCIILTCLCAILVCACYILARTCSSLTQDIKTLTNNCLSRPVRTRGTLLGHGCKKECCRENAVNHEMKKRSSKSRGSYPAKKDKVEVIAKVKRFLKRVRKTKNQLVRSCSF